MNLTFKQQSFDSISKPDYMRLLELRYDVFRKRLKWDLPTEGNLESDQYDTPDASYVYIEDDLGNILGCGRLIPTTKSYMLKEIFPELLGNQMAVESSHVYELSRFCINKNTSQSNCTLSYSTQFLFKALYLHAVENDISEYLTVSTLPIERMLKRTGIPFQRAGDQKVHRLGDTKSVTLSIKINDELRRAVMKDYDYH